MMNPEIRFRVTPEVYALAEGRAAELGLADPAAGKAAGVPLLARAALYQWLGLPWPDELPRPRGLVQALAPGRAVLTVHHSLDSEYREQKKLDSGSGLPVRAVTRLELDPAELPREVRGVLRIDAQGQLSGELHLPELSSAGELTLEGLVAYLRAHAARKMDRGQWAALLRSWAEEHGSELVRARVEEGFEWLELAEREWMRWQIRELVGADLDLEEFRGEQSLAGESWVHSVLPEREPDLDRISLLRGLRAALKANRDFRVTLVLGSRDQLQSKRRTATRPFRAVLWQLTTPAGHQLGLLSHVEEV